MPTESGNGNGNAKKMVTKFLSLSVFLCCVEVYKAKWLNSE